MPTILCSECFVNEGMKQNARRLGTASSVRCQNCGADDGSKLDADGLRLLFDEFFCSGSRAAAYLPAVFRSDTREEDINFEQTAKLDYELLKTVLATKLRRHTPALYLLGYTEIRSSIETALRQNPETASQDIKDGFDKSLAKLLSAATVCEFMTSERLYRARISPNNPLNPEEYDAPPTEKIVSNRVASPGRRVLCGALDITTCMAEIRPPIDDLIHHRIFLATLQPTRPLRLIDVTRVQVERQEERDTFWAFFAANDSSYRLTQIFSSFILGRGYDGLIYPSALSCIAPEERRTWKNLAIFGAPIAEEKVIVKSINRIVTKSVSYDVSLGPAWDDSRPGSHAYSPFMLGWLGRADWVPSD